MRDSVCIGYEVGLKKWTAAGEMNEVVSRLRPPLAALEPIVLNLLSYLGSFSISCVERDMMMMMMMMVLDILSA